MQEEKKKKEEDQSFNYSIDVDEEKQVERMGDESASPTQVSITLEDSEMKSTSSLRFGVNLLDELEDAYSCGLSRRLIERKMTKEKDDEKSGQGSGQAVLNSSGHGDEQNNNDIECEVSKSFETTEEAPVSPEGSTRAWKRMLSGGTGSVVLTREQALEMTIEALRHQLEDMTEERDSLLSTVDTLEGKLDAQNAKIEALEYFFRRMNAREDGDDSAFPTTKNSSPRQSSRSGDENSITSSSTATRSVSRSLSNTPSVRSVEVSDELVEEATSREEEYDDDEAWELEAAPPKLSVSFQKTGQKMRSAKTRAATKLARLTFV